MKVPIFSSCWIIHHFPARVKALYVQMAKKKKNKSHTCAHCTTFDCFDVIRGFGQAFSLLSTKKLEFPAKMCYNGRVQFLEGRNDIIHWDELPKGGVTALWHPYILAGVVNLLHEDSTAGKSCLPQAFIAVVTTGGRCHHVCRSVLQQTRAAPHRRRGQNITGACRSSWDS